jgi:hypothetical protein
VKTLKLVAVLIGIAAMVVWLLLEDITLQMVLIDFWTPLFVGILILQLVLVVTHSTLASRQNGKYAEVS